MCAVFYNVAIHKIVNAYSCREFSYNTALKRDEKMELRKRECKYWMWNPARMLALSDNTVSLTAMSN